MKMKIKFDKAALLKLLEEHVEKLVLGIFLVLTAVIVVGTFMKREQMTKKPEDLLADIKNAQTNLSKDKPVELKEHDYATDAKVSSDPIQAGPYLCTTSWTPPLAQSHELRGTPELLTVKDGLRGGGDFGSVRMAPASEAGAGEDAEGSMAGGQEDIKGKWWITITGAVPFKEQNLIYQKAFQNAISDPGASPDVPTYLGFEAQRLEAPLSGNVKDLDWKNAKLFPYTINSGSKIIAQWSISGNTTEVVPDTCVNPALTYPLAPLAEQEWTEVAAHAPEIPYNPGAQFTPAPAAEGHPEGKKDDAKKDKKDDPNAIFRPDETPTGTGGAPGIGGGMAIGGGPGHAPNPYSGRAGRGMLGGLGGGMGRNPYPTTNRPVDLNLDYYLLRYCDFTVDPGKRYVYRVRLVLANPNYKKKESILKDKNSGKVEVLRTDWSAPTEPITVPLDTRVLVKSTKPGNVILVKWKKETGAKVYREEKNVDRGSVLNFSKADATPAAGSQYGVAAPQPEEGHRREKADFISDLIVLDMSGGDLLPGVSGPGRTKMTVPGEMLVMDATGNISIRKEMSDHRDVAVLTGEPGAAGIGAAPGLQPPPHGNRQGGLMPPGHGGAPSPYNRGGRAGGAMPTPHPTQPPR
jgi:hypothetical protein